MWNSTFRLLTANLLQAMGSTGCGTAFYIMVVCCDWCISIRLCFHVPWFPQAIAGFSCVVVLMFSYCRHPRFRYFGSVVLVYVIWVESYVKCLFHFPCVPMAFSVNKLCFVPQRLVSGAVSVFWNRGILSACESYISVVFFHSFLHGFSCLPDADFAACAWYLVDYAVLLVLVSGIFCSDQPRS